MRALPKTEWTAKVVEWHGDKGYGWLQFGNKRLFLHARDHEGYGRGPRVNDEVRFILGQDREGRPCATRALAARGGHRVGFLRYGLLACLLVLPAIAIHGKGTHTVHIVAGLFLLSVITFAAYAGDKRRARRGDWRIPEFNLHLLEFLGGWPGAWLAQPYLRHKCSKTSYQIGFCFIILTHQFAAYDSLQNWNLARRAVHNVLTLKIDRESSTRPIPGMRNPVRFRDDH